MTNPREELFQEIVRQDDKYGIFGGHLLVGRLRLGIACLEDETKETLDAWEQDRKTGNWSHTREEALQTAAVAMRIVTQIDLESNMQ